MHEMQEVLVYEAVHILRGALMLVVPVELCVDNKKKIPFNGRVRSSRCHPRSTMRCLEVSAA